MEQLANVSQRKARSITSLDRPSGPRQLISPHKTIELAIVGATAGSLLAGCTTASSNSVTEIIPTAIVPATVTDTQPEINETPTNIPTELPVDRGVPYPTDLDIAPATIDSQEAYRQETQRTIDELILFFNSQGRDGQAEYDFLIQRLYQRLAFDVIRPVNGGAGGEGFDENARNTLFPDSNNFFEARLNDGMSWALVPKDNQGNFWVPGNSGDEGNFTPYTGLVPISYTTTDDFRMRRVETPEGTTAHLFSHPSGYIIIGFYDQAGQLASWWSAADESIHPVQLPIPTETPLVPTPVIPIEVPTVVSPTEAPTPTESVSAEFWDALEFTRGGDWSVPYPNGYINWRERSRGWEFYYAVDDSPVHDVPIPGLDGVTADLAVRAHYFDINGNQQTILIAIIIKLPDGSLIPTGGCNESYSRDEFNQLMIDHPVAFQIGGLGQIGQALIQSVDDFNWSWNRSGQSGQDALQAPGCQAYLRFAEINKTALEEFISTGSPTLEIIFPSGTSGVGGHYIFDNYHPTATP